MDILHVNKKERKANECSDWNVANSERNKLQLWRGHLIVFVLGLFFLFFEDTDFR